MKADWRGRLDAELEAAQSYRANKADWLDGRWAGFKTGGDSDDPRRGKTGVDIGTLKEIGGKITTLPAGFHLHRTLNRFLDSRRKAIEAGLNIDWATGEALAICSLLLDGHRVRLSGQDSERGTFSQRHSVLIDQETEQPLHAVQSPVADGQARFEVINSMLSEEAVLGFEYGYLARRAERADDVGSAVRRLRQRRAGAVRPVHLVGRAQMAAHVGPRLPVAAWLRRPGARAFLRAARALPADVRRRQYAGRQLHHAGELFPHPAPPAQARLPQAADPDDAEVAAAPQTRGVAARRNGTGDLVPPAAVGRRADCRRTRRSSSSPTTRSGAS